MPHDPCEPPANTAPVVSGIVGLRPLVGAEQSEQVAMAHRALGEPGTTDVGGQPYRLTE